MVKKMTSNDLIIIEAINNLEGKIIALQSEMNQRFEKLETEIRLNQNDTAHLQTTIYWGFALSTLLLGVIIAIVGFIVTLAPTIREYFASKQAKFATEEQVHNIVETAINKALIRH